MFLNIITPCTRPKNLLAIEKSINIPTDKFRWIVVFDLISIPKDIPSKCEVYSCVHPESGAGNAQRNFAISLIEDGHLYFNDDDTEMHPNLWNRIKHLNSYDFIHFSQACKDGSLRLKGERVANSCIDSHNFIVSRKCVGNIRWEIKRYDADGFFAEACYRKANSSIFIPEILSVYNSLR